MVRAGTESTVDRYKTTNTFRKTYHVKSMTSGGVAFAVLVVFPRLALADTAAVQTIDTLRVVTCTGACRDGDRLIASIQLSDGSSAVAIPVSDATGVGALRAGGITGVGVISSVSPESSRSRPLLVRSDASRAVPRGGAARDTSPEQHGSMSGSLLVFGSVMAAIGALGRRLAKPIA